MQNTGKTLDRKIRVLVVDDSAVVRKLFSERLGRLQGIEVVGTAPDPYVAREKIVLLQPDVVTLDVEMPRMDGITFLRKLMTHYPLPVVIISSLTQQGSRLAIEALQAGAVEVIAKPGLSDSAVDLGEVLGEKIRIASMCRPRQIPLGHSSEVQQEKGKDGAQFASDKIIAMGASTGGTEALRSVLQEMPPGCPPILVVQHMPAHFTKAFAERLNEVCRVEVKEAEDRELVVQGRVLIAPGDYHMSVDRRGAGCRVRLGKGPRVHYQRPSVEVLFQSVARCAGPDSIGVILTGMGGDGARGMKAMRDAGARTIAQDESTCVIFGMPREAIRQGGVEKVLPLDQIASGVLRMASDNGLRRLASP